MKNKKIKKTLDTITTSVILVIKMTNKNTKQGADKMNRNEAIEIVGIEAVKEVEAENVSHTNRVTDGTEDAGYVEFSAYVDIHLEDEERDESMLIMYVLVDEDDHDSVDDIDQIDWDRAIDNATFDIV